MIDDVEDRGHQQPGGNGDPPGGDPPSGEPLDDLIGPYLLDALTEEERGAFEAHLRASDAARREVAQLRPVVDLLPLTLDRSLDDPAATDVAPSPDLRERILAAARAADDRDAAASSETGPAAPIPPREPPARPVPAEPVPRRRPGRPRPPVRLFGVGADSGALRSGWVLAAAALAVIAVGALIWALSLRSQLDEREDELAGLAQTATAEAAGGGVQALAYIMRPTADGPETAGGVLFPNPQDPDTGNLNVLGLPALPEGRVYQLWFVELDDQGNPAVARPSVTFGVDNEGSGAIEVPIPAEPFDIVAVTQEPTGGSEAPTPPILMTGAPGTAAG